MRIGEVSRQTGVHTHQLRYYEAQGLLAPGRGANGYREYTGDAVVTVTQIRKLLDAGLSTQEIAYLLPCATGADPDRGPALSSWPPCGRACSGWTSTSPRSPALAKPSTTTSMPPNGVWRRATGNATPSRRSRHQRDRTLTDRPIYGSIDGGRTHLLGPCQRDHDYGWSIRRAAVPTYAGNETPRRSSLAAYAYPCLVISPRVTAPTETG